VRSRAAVPISLLLSVCVLLTLVGSPDRALQAAEIDVSKLTLEEKASLVTGKNLWETLAVPRLDIPSVWMADGPVGLRKSTGLAPADTVPATCFPSAAAMAATWNPQLIERVGAAIGAEARANQVSLLLGPGLNLKRHPLGGRNFEYYSEDPLLSGTIAAAFVRGVQSKGVGATLKHYAVNNQEHRRMTIDAQVDERTLRELYLRGFEIAVKKGRPQAVMSAYNKVNGVAASENRHLLTEILRDEWGFDGLVVSDWDAVDDPVAAIAAGLDLEMPGRPLTPALVIAAVNDGTLSEADLDRAVGAVLQLVQRHRALQDGATSTDLAAQNHELARQVAAESIVLLKNDGLLPVKAERQQRVGVIGSLAFEPRIQGIGASQVNPTRVDSPWVELLQVGKGDGHLVESWKASYDEEGLSDDRLQEVGEFLAGQDVVLVFAGQKASYDSELWDRPSMNLAPADLNLLEAARRSGRPFVVILVGGAAMDVTTFDDDAGAILLGWLGGQGFGSAVADVIFGHLSPSGRLSETFARSVADHPSAVNFPGGPETVRYGEGLYVGYRYFQSFDREVAYPFGHGLSYTTFSYLEAEAPPVLDDPGDGFDVSVQVKNSGDRTASETVQVYLRQLEPTRPRPDRQLIGFVKQSLHPGETRRFTVNVAPDRLAYYHKGHGRWVIEPGSYELLVGASAADIRLTLPIELTAGTMPREVYTLDHTVADIYRDPRGRAVIDRILAIPGTLLSQTADDDFFAPYIRSLPIRKLCDFSDGKLPIEPLVKLLELVNSDLSPEQVATALDSAFERETQSSR